MNPYNKIYKIGSPTFSIVGVNEIAVMALKLFGLELFKNMSLILLV